VSDADIITLSIGGVVVVLALLALLRVLMRKEPSPPRWLRFRVGMFVERDPRDDDRLP
jgi:hypothetical protein